MVKTAVDNYYASELVKVEVKVGDMSEFLDRKSLAHMGWSFVLGMIVTFAVSYGSGFSSGVLRGKKIMGKAMLEEIEKSQKDPMIKGE